MFLNHLRFRCSRYLSLTLARLFLFRLCVLIVSLCIYIYIYTHTDMYMYTLFDNTFLHYILVICIICVCVLTLLVCRCLSKQHICYTGSRRKSRCGTRRWPPSRRTLRPLGEAPWRREALDCKVLIPPEAWGGQNNIYIYIYVHRYIDKQKNIKIYTYIHIIITIG